MTNKNRSGQMNKQVQKILNPLYALMNVCPYCSITKLKNQYCDCPKGEEEYRKVVYRENDK